MTAHAQITGSTTPSDTARGPIVWLVRGAARVAQRRPKTIIALWLMFVVGCVMLGATVGTKSLTNAQSEVGQSAKADSVLDRARLTDPAAESILVQSPSAATTHGAAAALSAKLHALPQVASLHGPDDSAALSADHGRVVLLQATLAGSAEHAADHVGPLEDAVAAVQRAHPGAKIQEAGDGSENKAITTLIGDDLSRAERISLPITLLILVLAFGALMAASVPLLLGLTSVAAALGSLGAVSHLAPSSNSTSAVVVLIGLAVGVDYSLFYVRREREERRKGLPEARDRHHRQTSALDAAAASVGRAIAVSGAIVMVALAGLLITHQGDFVSMALGTVLVVLIAVIGSLTVLPAVLALLGDRVDRGRVPGLRRLQERRARREVIAGRRLGFWAGLARAVTKRPVASLVISASILGALAVPLTTMHTAGLSVTDLPPNLPVSRAIKSIEHHFPGAPQDAELVVQGARLTQPGAKAGLVALGQRAARVTGGHGPVTVAVSSDGRAARVDVPMPDVDNAATKAVIAQLRGTVARSANRVPGVTENALVTGQAASSMDYTARMASATPEVIGFVLALGFLLLLFTFRAPLLAAAVMALNLLSIGAAYGILTAIFQHTWAEHLLGFHSTGHIIDWLPLFMFVVLFGLSTDYTILVLERIREARLAGLRPRQAAAEGVAATAGAVTSAAAVMFAVFAVFGSLDVINFKQIGIGLAAAVLLDAGLVRGVALPAVVTLLGERGWPIRRPRRAHSSEPVVWAETMTASLSVARGGETG
jgi:RND superfamily putative drug exporter